MVCTAWHKLLSRKQQGNFDYGANELKMREASTMRPANLSTNAKSFLERFDHSSVLGGGSGRKTYCGADAYDCGVLEPVGTLGSVGCDSNSGRFRHPGYSPYTIRLWSDSRSNFFLRLLFAHFVLQQGNTPWKETASQLSFTE